MIMQKHIKTIFILLCFIGSLIGSMTWELLSQAVSTPVQIQIAKDKNGNTLDGFINISNKRWAIVNQYTTQEITIPAGYSSIVFSSHDVFYILPLVTGSEELIVPTVTDTSTDNAPLLSPIARTFSVTQFPLRKFKILQPQGGVCIAELF
jgi:hypothetical protein